MDAIEWLNDLEAKADAATPGTWKQKETEQCGLFPLVLSEKNGIKYNVARTGVIYPFSEEQCYLDAAFIAAANPETVKRLVMMINALAVGCECDADPCLYGACTKQCRIEKAYADTEPKA